MNKEEKMKKYRECRDQIKTMLNKFTKEAIDNAFRGIMYSDGVDPDLMQLNDTRLSQLILAAMCDLNRFKNNGFSSMKEIKNIQPYIEE